MTHLTSFSTARNSRASFSRSTANWLKQRRQKVCKASAAQVSSFIRVLPVASDPFKLAPQAGASASCGGPGRVHLKGLRRVVHDVFSFAPVRLVRQLVQVAILPINHPTEAPMGQREMPLLQRIEGPAVVPPAMLTLASTYRQAVRVCWGLRRVKWTPATLAAHYGFTRQHIGDWLNPDDKPTRRSLPAERITDFEEACGNVMLTQWLASRQRLTVLEELQAARLA